MKVGGILVLCAIVTGACLGMGFYTFIYAKGASYLTNDAQACANCHVMQSQYDAWLKSSHRSVASCNDCHTPHNFFGKYMTKALNGFNHSLAMTSGRFHEPIQIGPRNKEIAEAACRYCHAEVVDVIDGPHGTGENVSCIRCHASVGHESGQ